MKRENMILWRALRREAPWLQPLSPRRALLLFLASFLAALATFFLHLGMPPLSLDPDAQEAARLMLRCLGELKSLREEISPAAERLVADNSFSDQNMGVDPRTDPIMSGMIGVEYTDLTSTVGDLRAKQTSVNPQFAALAVMWLKAAGVKKGDPVAVSLSGSFPALNLAVLLACDVLELNPIIFSSVGASSFGANIPGFTWLDMERHLQEKELLAARTAYASLGGIMDTEGGLGETGIQLGEMAIARHGAEYVHEGTPRSVVHDLERRLALYETRGRPAAFINVGGNVTALGWVAESALLENGLLLPPGHEAPPGVRAAHRLPPTSSPRRGLVFRMFEKGIPVLHLLNIESLAAANSLPVPPKEVSASYDLRKAWNKRELTLGFLFLLWLAACLPGIHSAIRRGAHSEATQAFNAPSLPRREQTTPTGRP